MRSFRAEFPRLFELKDSIANPESPDAYFQKFEENLADAHIRKVYLLWERTLQELDANAWNHMVKTITPLLTKRNKGRGWQALFDTLGEARAYRYLKSIGCAAIQFIPRSNNPTPDLEGTVSSAHLLCEVKTINISDEEVEARTNLPKVRTLPVNITPRFLRKLSATVDKAKGQLLSHDPQCVAVHLVYLNIVFDDFFAECKEAYFREIDEYLTITPVPGVRIIICNDYTAFYKPLQMRNAQVDNVG